MPHWPPYRDLQMALSKMHELADTGFAHGEPLPGPPVGIFAHVNGRGGVGGGVGGEVGGMYVPSTSSHPFAGAVVTFFTRSPCTANVASPWKPSMARACTCVGVCRPRLDQSTSRSHAMVSLAQLAILTRVCAPFSTYAVARTWPVRPAIVVSCAMCKQMCGCVCCQLLHTL